MRVNKLFNIIRVVAIALTVTGFLGLLGTVGAVDTETIGLVQAIKQLGLFIGMMGFGYIVYSIVKGCE